MRTAPRPSFTQHRLSRFTKWLTLMFAYLAWLVREWGDIAFVFDDAVRRLAKSIAHVVVIRASRRVRGLRKRRRHGSVKPHRPAMRAAIGSALRNALRGRTLHERLVKLGQALANIDALVDKLVRRLTRGLTRLRPLLTRAGDDALSPSTWLAFAHAADTS